MVDVCWRRHDVSGLMTSSHGYGPQKQANRQMRERERERERESFNTVTVSSYVTSTVIKVMTMIDMRSR